MICSCEAFWLRSCSFWFYKDVTELSGGQKQLLSLASVMAMQPGVLVLDEPMLEKLDRIKTKYGLMD